MLFLRSLQTEIVVETMDVMILQVSPQLHRLSQIECSSFDWSNDSWEEIGDNRGGYLLPRPKLFFLHTVPKAYWF